MLLGDFFYGIALILLIYVIISITSTGKVALTDAIAALGVVVFFVLGFIAPSGSPKTPVENPVRDTTEIAGDWAGTITGDTVDFSSELEISIKAGCSIGSICGREKVPQTSCAGDLKLVEVTGRTFYFLEESCARGSAQITLFSNETLSWIYQAGSTKSHATLSRK